MTSRTLVLGLSLLAAAGAPPNAWGAAPVRRGIAPPPRPAISTSSAVSPATVFVGRGAVGAAGLRESARASRIFQVATYPANGAIRVPATAVPYVVFSEPTSKSGIFEIGDFDTGSLVNLDSPRWSALGDTVFLKPSQPMPFGHQMGMRVDLIAAPGDTAVNLPIVYFTIIERANVQRIPSDGPFPSATLIPGTPVPVAIDAQGTTNDAATFTSARVEFWPSATAPLTGGSPASPLDAYTVPVAFTVPALGTARLSAPVTLPNALARNAASGLLGLRIRFDGYDETGLPYSFEATSAIQTPTPTDTTLVMSQAQVTPAIASDLVVRQVIVESPLPGAMFAAGDTVRAGAVVTGYGTGAFRAVFYIDGDVVAMEEGYMESGRPVTVTPQGPMGARRFGEHRFQFVVEYPQNVAAQPLTILCVPPANGIAPPPDLEARAKPDSAAARGPSRLTLGGTWLADGSSTYQDQSSSLVGWSAWTARYDLSRGRRLEGNVLWRLNLTDPENGSGRPEQFVVRAAADSGAVEWGDITPRLAAGAPLFASAVPRRSAQAVWRGSALGEVSGFVALESHPRSSAGPIESLRSDLYAGRLTRGFGGERFTASLYGGYVHSDPTPAAVESLVLASGVYGGMGTLRAGAWSLLGDIATVHHKEIAGVAPAESPTGVRGVLSGTVSGFAARAEAFRYQPNLATALNPYALSDRKGGSADLAKSVGLWRFFGNYRKEKPDQDVGAAPVIDVTRYEAGARLTLNRGSYVTPAYIHIHNSGVNTDYTEQRAATEFSRIEDVVGRTSARIDIALMQDTMVPDSKLRLVSGSLVSTRRPHSTTSTTISLGYEDRNHVDLDLNDRTFQGALEMRIEAMPGKLLILPYLAYIGRDYESLIQKQQTFTGRLQVAFLRIPHLSESAVAIEGRVTNTDQTEPFDSNTTDASVTITLGQRYHILGGR